MSVGKPKSGTKESWAINAAHVRELRPVGAGDYEIELASGLKAPLSRRFPAALERLRRAGEP